jgi:hypothetical protein
MQLKEAGIALIMLGCLVAGFTVLEYTTSEHLQSAGLLPINEELYTNLIWQPLTGALLFIAGFLLIAFYRKKKKPVVPNT